MRRTQRTFDARSATQPATRRSCLESRGRMFSRTAFASALTSPLRTAAPYGPPAHRLGDCAGRSPGSRVVACRPAFPVSQWPRWTQARRLQLRGQPRIPHTGGFRVPSCLPGRTGEPTRDQASQSHEPEQSSACRRDPHCRNANAIASRKSSPECSRIRDVCSVRASQRPHGRYVMRRVTSGFHARYRGALLAALVSTGRVACRAAAKRRQTSAPPPKATTSTPAGTSRRQPAPKRKTKKPKKQQQSELQFARTAIAAAYAMIYTDARLRRRHREIARAQARRHPDVANLIGYLQPQARPLRRFQVLVREGARRRSEPRPHLVVLRHVARRTGQHAQGARLSRRL